MTNAGRKYTIVHMSQHDEGSQRAFHVYRDGEPSSYGCKVDARVYPNPEAEALRLAEYAFRKYDEAAALRASETDAETLAKMAEILRRGGSLVCASDVYRPLVEAIERAGLARAGYALPRIVVSQFVPPGTVAALAPVPTVAEFTAARAPFSDAFVSLLYRTPS